MNDWELIQAYCRDGSESAFTALVNRHVDFVHCAALRQVRDPSLAQDISQAVFLLLARKAGSLRQGTVLVSWLFRSTRFIATRALRSNYRRQRRELEAATMNPQTTASESDHEWEIVAPVLDEALAALSQKDRDVVLLRFISRKSFSQVGAEIGVSEDAAKKRASRALARLREFFIRRGTTLSVAAIAAILADRVVQASPVAVASKISAALGAGASATASTSSAALLEVALRELAWGKLKWGAAACAAIIGALLLVSIAMRAIRREQAIPIPQAAALQSKTSVVPNRALADASSSNGAVSDRAMNLLIVRLEDRQPARGARVLVECLSGKATERSLDATTDRFGAVRIPIPSRAFNELRVWVGSPVSASTTEQRNRIGGPSHIEGMRVAFADFFKMNLHWLSSLVAKTTSWMVSNPSASTSTKSWPGSTCGQLKRPSTSVNALMYALPLCFAIRAFGIGVPFVAVTRPLSDTPLLIVMTALVGNPGNALIHGAAGIKPG
jgi:RNA polymerase sigma factor (sigma-70 family)